MAAAGIDDISFYIPQLYLPVKALAEKRGIPYDKLRHGLGLEAMALPDVREDTATLAANAILDLLHKNDLSPAEIGRIYCGTESGLDGSKPVATYALSMLQEHFEMEHGPHCFLHCDVVDMTFACIGAVDALQNTLDWVQAGRDRIGIVVAADIARYEMGSTGEYTQGAGAVAILVRENPRLMTIEGEWGVATRGVHDFFKPLRKVDKQHLVEEVLDMLGSNGMDREALQEHYRRSIECQGVLDSNESELVLHKSTPVFDGPHSNDCYQARIREALIHYRRLAGQPTEALTDRWKRLVFHLPYAYHGRRIFSEIFMEELKLKGEWDRFTADHDLEHPCAEDFDDRDEFLKSCGKFLKAITKTEPYRNFVADKIERGERASTLVGNLYTGSIFLALISTLEADLADGNELEGESIGFFAYGSGSKSKVFSGRIASGWREITGRLGLMQRLQMRTPIEYDTYEQMHRRLLSDNISHTAGAFFLADIHDEPGDEYGARTYGYRAIEVDA